MNILKTALIAVAAIAMVTSPALAGKFTLPDVENKATASAKSADAKKCLTDPKGLELVEDKHFRLIKDGAAGTYQFHDRILADATIMAEVDKCLGKKTAAK